jgi:hypothetical protein
MESHQFAAGNALSSPRQNLKEIIRRADLAAL